MEKDPTKLLLAMGDHQIPSMGEKVQANAGCGNLDWGIFDTRSVRDPNTQCRHHHHMFIKLSNNFSTPPTIIVGLVSLEMDRGANVRVIADAEGIQEHIFHAHIWSWADSKLYRASFAWLAVPSGHPDLQTGTFSTSEVYSSENRQQFAHRKVVFHHRYATPPTVVVWLKILDISNEFNERVVAFATDITATGFTAHINTWGSTVLYWAAMSWFAYPAGYPGICSGVVLGTSEAVRFEYKFTTPPKAVFVGLNKLDTDIKGRCSFNIITEAVSETGMGVRVEGLGDTILHDAGVSYIAIEEGLAL